MLRGCTLLRELQAYFLVVCRVLRDTRNSSGDEIANANIFYNDIFNYFYAVRPGNY